MAGANTQQYGIKNWRIYREPIDGEAVHLSYQDIKDRLITNSDGSCTAKTPMGLFEDLYIDNDIDYVVKQIKKYNEEE